MSFARDRLPDPQQFFEDEGLKLDGRGKWRTTECVFHGGSDSMRVNVDSGAWVCMACGEKGGDVLSFLMARYGVEFVDACKLLGCWDESRKSTQVKPAPFSYRAALEVLRFDALHLAVYGSNVANGTAPTDRDRKAALEAAGRIEFIAGEVLGA